MGSVCGNGNANRWQAAPGDVVPSFSNLYSVHFNGTNQFLGTKTANSPLFGEGGTDDFSISFWVKADTMSTGSNQRLWASGVGSTLQTQMYITTGGNLQFAGPWSDGYSWGKTSGTWNHVVYRVRRDITSQNVGYVINGTEINNKSETITTTFDSTGYFYVGRNVGSFGFEGNIDEFAVWNKYLTDAECIEVYNGGAAPALNSLNFSSFLQHWWRMGDPSGPPTYPLISDFKGSLDLIMNAQTGTNIETDVP